MGSLSEKPLEKGRKETPHLPDPIGGYEKALGSPFCAI